MYLLVYLKPDDISIRNGLETKETKETNEKEKQKKIHFRLNKISRIKHTIYNFMNFCCIFFFVICFF